MVWGTISVRMWGKTVWRRMDEWQVHDRLSLSSRAKISYRQEQSISWCKEFV